MRCPLIYTPRMAPPAHYQVVMLGPGLPALRSTLENTLKKRVADLGLDAALHLRLLDEGNFKSEVEWRGPLVCVYFGGAKPSATTVLLLEEIIRAFVFVLPVVDSLDAFSKKVPKCLQVLNGLPLDPADLALEGIVNRLLEELRLVRGRRAAFVSYRRSESSGVATQVFHELEERRYRVFVDTFCVEHGRPFQEALWNRMLDTDILVFLHTAGALGSRWVEEEFARASQLGVGILNIIWPGHVPVPAAAFGEQLYLDDTDFLPGYLATDPRAQLTSAALVRIAVNAESLRARSMADRRRRVIETFCRRVDAFVRRTGTTELRVVVQGNTHLQLLRGRRKVIRVYPVVGHPDTSYAQEIADACSIRRDTGCLLFDSNGIDDALAGHFRWLNQHLPVQSFSTKDVEEWLPKL
jgi:hypothetical protein